MPSPCAWNPRHAFCATILAGAKPVGAVRDDERRLQHHRLLEVQLVEPPLALRIAGDDDRDAVQVARRSAARDSVAQYLLHERGIDRVGLEAADRPMAFLERGDRGHARFRRWTSLPARRASRERRFGIWPGLGSK